MPAFPCLSCPSLTTPTSLSVPAVPVLAPPVPPFLIAPFAACLIFPQHFVRCRITPCLPNLIDPIRDFPNPTITRPFSPCLPDLNSPCITFRLATLTHLACVDAPRHIVPMRAEPLPSCRAFIIPTVPLPSIPIAFTCHAHLSRTVRAFLSAPATSIPARPRRSPPICIRHSVPANPFLVFPLVHSPHLSHPRLLLLSYPSFPDPYFPYAVLPDLLIRAFSSLTSRHLPLRIIPFLPNRAI